MTSKIQCCGSGMFIPDLVSDLFPSGIPDPSFYPGSASKNFSILTKKKRFLSSRLWSGLFIPDPGSGSLLFTYPGSPRIQGPKRQHWIRNTGRILTTEQCCGSGSGTFCRIRIRIRNKSFRIRIRPIPNFFVKKSHFLNQMRKKSEYLAHIYI
jgi:hypothetical protein